MLLVSPFFVCGFYCLWPLFYKILINVGKTQHIGKACRNAALVRREPMLHAVAALANVSMAY
jgi:hypothetical protein